MSMKALLFQQHHLARLQPQFIQRYEPMVFISPRFLCIILTVGHELYFIVPIASLALILIFATFFTEAKSCMEMVLAHRAKGKVTC